jgi:hypothetical protein
MCRVPCLYIVMMFRSRHELREMRLLELTLEADYERNKLLAENADTREQKELMSKAEEAHDAALAEYEALREKLPTALRKLTAGYELRCFGFEIFECMRKIALGTWSHLTFYIRNTRALLYLILCLVVVAVGLPVFFRAGSPGQLVLGLLTCVGELPFELTPSETLFVLADVSCSIFSARSS